MAWVDISEDVYKVNYTDTYGSDMSGKVKLTLQYDNSKLTPTSVSVRFKFDRKSSTDSVNYYDSMYVLYDANDNEDGRTLLKLKGYKTSGKNWPFYSSAFTIKKSYTSSTFCVEDLWICNNGGNVVTATASEFYASFNGTRKKLKCTKTSQNVSINTSVSVASAATVLAPVVEDRGSNDFNIKVSKDSIRPGTNNPITSAYLYMKRATDADWVYVDDLTQYTDDYTVRKVLDINPNASTSAVNHPSKASQVVQAKIVMQAKYNKDDNEGSAYVKQHVKPSKPGTPVIVPVTNCPNGRITNKSKVSYQWSPASPGNASSPVSGYRVRVYHKRRGQSDPDNRKFTDLLFYTENGIRYLASSGWCQDHQLPDAQRGVPLNNETAAYFNIGATQVPENDWATTGINVRVVGGLNMSAPRIELDLEKLGMQAGDQIRFGVYSYHRTSNESSLYNGGGAEGEQALSAWTEIQNRAAVRVKVKGDWKIGIVHVKVKGEWKEAEALYAKSKGVWQTAE